MQQRPLPRAPCVWRPPHNSASTSTAVARPGDDAAMDTIGSPLILVRSLDGTEDTRQTHARAASRGHETRVAPGAYVEAAAWRALDPREQYLLRVRAVAETRRNRPVLSHWSAAAVHGLPQLGRWPTEVHITIGRTAGGRSHNGVTKHSLPLRNEDVVEIDGMLLTSVARTVVDLAAVTSFVSAVAVADRALWVDRRGRVHPLADRERIDDAYVGRGRFIGFARARAAIDFGVSLADSAFESVSRVNMWRIGCPRPILQSSFNDYRGRIGETDFDWPDFSLVGEADGRTKYLDPLLRAGRTLEQVLLREKDRGDRLQGIGRRVSRWGWATGVNPDALRRHLVAAGLPMGQRW